MNSYTSTVLLNSKEGSYHAFIGRGSLFANPFFGKDNDLALYKKWIWNQYLTNYFFRVCVNNLDGKRIACTCKDLDHCHGRVIIQLLDFVKKARFANDENHEQFAKLFTRPVMPENQRVFRSKEQFARAARYAERKLAQKTDATWSKTVASRFNNAQVRREKLDANVLTCGCGAVLSRYVKACPKCNASRATIEKMSVPERWQVAERENLLRCFICNGKDKDACEQRGHARTEYWLPIYEDDLLFACPRCSHEFSALQRVTYAGGKESVHYHRLDNDHDAVYSEQFTASDKCFELLCPECANVFSVAPTPSRWDGEDQELIDRRERTSPFQQRNPSRRFTNDAHDHESGVSRPLRTLDGYDDATAEASQDAALAQLLGLDLASRHDKTVFQLVVNHGLDIHEARLRSGVADANTAA
ncbi:MAG: DUF4326 domain-containing protein [Thermoanaerobaculia bacterium]